MKFSKFTMFLPIVFVQCLCFRADSIEKHNFSRKNATDTKGIIWLQCTLDSFYFVFVGQCYQRCTCFHQHHHGFQIAFFDRKKRAEKQRKWHEKNRECFLRTTVVFASTTDARIVQWSPSIGVLGVQNNAFLRVFRHVFKRIFAQIVCTIGIVMNTVVNGTRRRVWSLSFRILPKQLKKI